MTKDIKYSELTWFTGRNGLFKSSGLNVRKSGDDHLHLIPITSKKALAHCDIVIHKDSVKELIEILTKEF